MCNEQVVFQVLKKNTNTNTLQLYWPYTTESYTVYVVSLSYEKVNNGRSTNSKFECEYIIVFPDGTCMLITA